MYRFQRQLVTVQIATDLILMNVAFAVAYYVRYYLRFPVTVAEENFIPYTDYIPISILLSLGLIIIYHIEGIYNVGLNRSWFEEFYSLVSATFTGIVITVAFFFFYRPLFYSRLIYVYAGVFIVIILSLARVILWGIISYLRQRGIGVDRVLVVGAGEVGLAILRNVLAQPGLGYQIIGYVDDDPERAHSEIGRYSGLGTTAEIPALVTKHKIDEVIIALPWRARDKIVEILNQCEARDIRTKIVPDLFEMSLSRVVVDSVGSIPLIRVQETTIRGGSLAIKRVMDVLLTLTFSLLTLPIMAFCMLLIRLDSPGPVIFRQKRAGRDNTVFTAYKFRTMREGADEEKPQLAHLNEARGAMFKIRDDPRVTRVGKWLRRLSLDELPQMWNVLRGDMSWVGPRPALLDEAEQYNEWQKRRLGIAPGITGLWQVSGRSNLTFEEMVLLDIYYIENWSPWLDMEILLRTVPAVLLARGAY
jgi:exopolysaccharide biosynthesis polyprenyl glycosylphosphotransferase